LKTRLSSAAALPRAVVGAFADASSNSAAMTYDWRNRRIVSKPAAGPQSLSKYDNLDRLVASGAYKNSATLTASSDPTSGPPTA
jgi:hypothetical protein